MTSFYKFDTKEQYYSLTDNMSSYYTTKDGIAISVIGDYWVVIPENAPEDFLPIYKGFLVNTLVDMEGWDAFKVNVTSPMRIFG